MGDVLLHSYIFAKEDGYLAFVQLEFVQLEFGPSYTV